MLQLLVLSCVNNGVAVALWGPATTIPPPPPPVVFPACTAFVLAWLCCCCQKPDDPLTFFWPGPVRPGSQFPVPTLGTMVKMELFKIASKVYMNIITIETKSWSPKVNNLLGLETSPNQAGDYGIAKWV